MAAAIAMITDRMLGEPPAALHPVVAMGRWLTWAGHHLAAVHDGAAPPRRRGLLGGAVGWATGLALTVAVAVAVERMAARAGRGAPVVRGLALSTLLSSDLLQREVEAVERALDRGVDAGRIRVARLVSRPVRTLDATGVRMAAIESLAENASDSVVAPLLWYSLGGLPTAAAYRFVNTADAMWGYRGVWDHAGRTAARADDLANLVPARLTGLALAGRGTGVRRLAATAALTPSPNAGWPMAAVALRHGIRLTKAGVYDLNAAGRPPAPSDTRDVGRRVRAVCWSLAAVAGLVDVARGRW